MTWPSSPQQPGYPEQPGGSPYPGYSLGPQQYPRQPTEPYPGYQPGASYPSSGQPYPSYDYPQQPQPGYPPQQPQPGYPPAGQPYPGYMPPTPPQKSNASKIALIMLAVVLLIAIGGGTAAFLLLRDKDKPADPAAQSSPSATASESASPTPSETTPTQTTVVAPPTLAGRKKLEHPELDAIVDELVTELEQDLPMADKVVGGLYGNLLTQDLVMLVAAAVPIANPEREFDDAVEAMSDSMGVTSMSTVDPGPLGGFAKCGDGESDGTPVAVCVWVDNDSLGILAFFNNDVESVRSEFIAARSEVEQRS